MSWGRLPDVSENNKMFIGKESVLVSNKSKSASVRSLSNNSKSEKFKDQDKSKMH